LIADKPLQIIVRVNGGKMKNEQELILDLDGLDYKTVIN